MHEALELTWFGGGLGSTELTVGLYLKVLFQSK